MTIQQRLTGVTELTFLDRRFLKQLLKGNKKEVLKPDNQMTKEECKMAFPKAKWFQPQESPTQKAEIPEDLLQDYANEAILLKGWTYIRFHTALLGWIKNNPAVPQWVRKCFFSQVAGKLPDNLIMAQVAPGMFLAVKMELKTQDKKGRIVGKTHGKQKLYAEAEEWYIARSPEKINEVLEIVNGSLELTKRALAGPVAPPDITKQPSVHIEESYKSISQRYAGKYADAAKKLYENIEKEKIVSDLIDTKTAIKAGYSETAISNIDELIEMIENK